ncbi:hypothetical protein DFH11DRAFT_1743846 [Phellopilus nigrolimitatus]|nr:hypothetical protein DFH11DRAFT_1743846 [Phellopilus nigrolimitatus]
MASHRGQAKPRQDTYVEKLNISATAGKKIKLSNEAYWNAVKNLANKTVSYSNERRRTNGLAKFPMAKKTGEAGSTVDNTKTIERYALGDLRSAEKEQDARDPEGHLILDMKEAYGSVKEAMKAFMDKRTNPDNLNRDKWVNWSYGILTSIANNDLRTATEDQKKATNKELDDVRIKLNDALSKFDKADLDRLNAVGLSAMYALFKSSEKGLRAR